MAAANNLGQRTLPTRRWQFKGF